MRTLCGTILAATFAFGAAVAAEVPKNGKSETRGVLCLTFDDSHFDDWEAVIPLFEKYNARATFFARGELPPRHIAGMRRLSEAGHSIGLHGRLHVRAPVYLGEHGTDTWLRDEILPQIDICRSAGLPTRNFAYPYNARTDETDGILRVHGFARLRGVFTQDLVTLMSWKGRFLRGWLANALKCVRSVLASPTVVAQRSCWRFCRVSRKVILSFQLSRTASATIRQTTEFLRRRLRRFFPVRRRSVSP